MSDQISILLISIQTLDSSKSNKLYNDQELLDISKKAITNPCLDYITALEESGLIGSKLENEDIIEIVKSEFDFSALETEEKFEKECQFSFNEFYDNFLGKIRSKETGLLDEEKLY